jgi:hypothetical protein
MRNAFIGEGKYKLVLIFQKKRSIQRSQQDGMYLPSAPRTVTSLPLFNGARADVAIRCTGSASSVVLKADLFRFPVTTVLASYNALSLKIAASSTTAPNLPTFKVI